MAGVGQVDDDVDLIAGELPPCVLLATDRRWSGDHAAAHELPAAAEHSPIAQFARMGTRPDLGRGRPANDDGIAALQLPAVEIVNLTSGALERREQRLDLS